MSDMIQFREKMRKHIDSMLAGNTTLFATNADKDVLWNLYLDSFPPGTNEIYRERREHDCSACRHFIKAFGHVVKIKDREVTTIWDFDAGEYQPIADALAGYIRSLPVTDVFLTDTKKIGHSHDYETALDGTKTRYDHLHYTLPQALVYKGHDTIGAVQGRYRDTKNVFKRALEEISSGATDAVLELIAQGSLYRGEEWKEPLTIFQACQDVWNGNDLYAWEMSVNLGVAVAKIRNHSIGVLLQDITSGVDLDEAVRCYEKIVAPTNYKRPKAIFTKRMLDDARNTVAELGFMDSLGRRHARLEDITVNNILFINRDEAKKVQGVFEKMGADLPVSARQFARIAEVPAEKFFSDILPTAQSVEALFSGCLTQNLMSLIAPAVPGSPSMFKWDNGFSWAYNGNVADSMREQVEKAGGSVTGCLRFSIRWNDQSDYDGNDEDAHCILPNRDHIYFGRKIDYETGGNLDVDIINPVHGKPAIENIAFPSLDRMPPGRYVFYVHCYSARGGQSGFDAEIEFDGQIYQFEYRKPLRQSEKVVVAEVELKNGKFSIVKSLDPQMSSREVWGLKTNTFIPVSTIMYSPNYWDDGTGNGNKHYFFMLKDCINPDTPNGFYNEFLRNDLLQHKRVFEALGSEMRVQPAKDQLSGLGFSSTLRNSLICRVKGSIDRVVKIIF